MAKEIKADNLTEKTTLTETSYLFLGAREIIKESLNKNFLNEDGEGGDSGMAGGGGLGSDNASLGTVAGEYRDSMGGMGGQNYGATKGNELFNIFLQPFLDIFLTGLWGIEKLTQWSKSFLSMLLKGSLATVVPFIRMDYTEMWQKHHQKMEGVDKDFHEVLQRNEEAMKMTDVWGMFFLMDPTAFIGLNIASGGKDGIKKLYKLFLGGLPTSIWNKLSSTSQTVIDQVRQLSDPTLFVRTRRSFNPLDVKTEGLMELAKTEPKTETKELTDEQLNNEKFKKEVGVILATSPEFIKMQNQVADNMLLPLKTIVLSKTLVQLNQNMNNKLSETLKEFEADKKSTPAEKEVIEAGIITKIKEKAVEEFKEQIKLHASKNKKFGDLLMKKVDAEIAPLVSK